MRLYSIVSPSAVLGSIKSSCNMLWSMRSNGMSSSATIHLRIFCLELSHCGQMAASSRPARRALLSQVRHERRARSEHVQRIRLIHLGHRLVQERVPDALFVAGEPVKAAKPL